jgi:hypothetical protein
MKLFNFSRKPSWIGLSCVIIVAFVIQFLDEGEHSVAVAEASNASYSNCSKRVKLTFKMRDLSFIGRVTSIFSRSDIDVLNAKPVTTTVDVLKLELNVESSGKIEENKLPNPFRFAGAIYSCSHRSALWFVDADEVSNPDGQPLKKKKMIRNDIGSRNIIFPNGMQYMYEPNLPVLDFLTLIYSMHASKWKDNDEILLWVNNIAYRVRLDVTEGSNQKIRGRIIPGSDVIFEVLRKNNGGGLISFEFMGGKFDLLLSVKGSQ